MGDHDKARETVKHLRKYDARTATGRLTHRAADLITALAEENRRLREALEQIAIQKRTDELVTVLDVEFADFEGGYDLCIDCARAALSSGEGE